MRKCIKNKFINQTVLFFSLFLTENLSTKSWNNTFSARVACILQLRTLTFFWKKIYTTLPKKNVVKQQTDGTSVVVTASSGSSSASSLSSSQVGANNKRVQINDLTPETDYIIRVTGNNGAGSTTAEYEISTLLVKGGNHPYITGSKQKTYSLLLPACIQSPKHTSYTLAHKGNFFSCHLFFLRNNLGKCHWCTPYIIIVDYFLHREKKFVEEKVKKVAGAVCTIRTAYVVLCGEGCFYFRAVSHLLIIVSSPRIILYFLFCFSFSSLSSSSILWDWKVFLQFCLVDMLYVCVSSFSWNLHVIILPGPVEKRNVRKVLLRLPLESSESLHSIIMGKECEIEQLLTAFPIPSLSKNWREKKRGKTY